MLSIVRSITLRASGTVVSPARPAWMVRVVWRLSRRISVAPGITATSTIAISGTVRPSGARTVKPAMSSTPKLSASSNRTHTGTSFSPWRKSRSCAPRSASATNCDTSCALKPNAAARSRSTRTVSSLFWSPLSTRTSRKAPVLLARIGTMSRASSASTDVESPTSCTCTLPPSSPPPRSPMPILARADLGSSLPIVSTRAFESLTDSSNVTSVPAQPCSLYHE